MNTSFLFFCRGTHLLLVTDEHIFSFFGHVDTSSLFLQMNTSCPVFCRWTHLLLLGDERIFSPCCKGTHLLLFFGCRGTLLLLLDGWTHPLVFGKGAHLIFCRGTNVAFSRWLLLRCSIVPGIFGWGLALFPLGPAIVSLVPSAFIVGSWHFLGNGDVPLTTRLLLDSVLPWVCVCVTAAVASGNSLNNDLFVLSMVQDNCSLHFLTPFQHARSVLHDQPLWLRKVLAKFSLVQLRNLDQHFNIPLPNTAMAAFPRETIAKLLTSELTLKFLVSWTITNCSVTSCTCWWFSTTLSPLCTCQCWPKW